MRALIGWRRPRAGPASGARRAGRARSLEPRPLVSPGARDLQLLRRAGPGGRPREPGGYSGYCGSAGEGCWWGRRREPWPSPSEWNSLDTSAHLRGNQVADWEVRGRVKRGEPLPRRSVEVGAALRGLGAAALKPSPSLGEKAARQFPRDRGLLTWPSRGERNPTPRFPRRRSRKRRGRLFLCPKIFLGFFFSFLLPPPPPPRPLLQGHLLPLLVGEQFSARGAGIRIKVPATPPRQNLSKRK